MQRSKPRRSKPPKQPILSCYGVVLGWEPYMFVRGDRRHGICSRESLRCLNISGTFTSPIRTISRFMLRIYPDADPQANNDAVSSIGVWIGMRPLFDGVVKLSLQEFDFVLAMAQASKLVSIHLCFQKPFYNRSAITSVSFSSEPPDAGELQPAENAPPLSTS